MFPLLRIRRVVLLYLVSDISDILEIFSRHLFVEVIQICFRSCCIDIQIVALFFLRCIQLLGGLIGLFSFKFLLSGLTISNVGRRSLCSLRPGNLNVLGHVGGRYARSDLQDSIFTITDVIKMPKNLKTK